MAIPSFSQIILLLHLTPLGLEYKSSKLYLRPGDMFLLGRLVSNVKGSVMEELLDEIMRYEGVKSDLELSDY